MVFKNIYSKKAVFDFDGKRYQCKDGLFDAGEDAELEEFLKANPCFVVECGEPAKKVEEPEQTTEESDGLDNLTDDELRAVILDRGLLSEGQLAQIKSRETLLKNIRGAK